MTAYFNRQFFVLAFVTFCLAACGSSAGNHTVTFRVVSDLKPGIEAATATVDMLDASGTVVEHREQALVAGDVLARGVQVATIENVSGGTHTFVIELLRPNGERLAGRPYIADVHADVTFSVVITANCADVECPAAGSPALTACLAGQCVDPRCSVSTPEFCPAFDFCGEDNECAHTDVAECVEAKCTEGVCIDTPADNACNDADAGAGADADVLDAGVAQDATILLPPDAAVPDAAPDATMDAGRIDMSLADATPADVSTIDFAIDAFAADAATDLPLDAEALSDASSEASLTDARSDEFRCNGTLSMYLSSGSNVEGETAPFVYRYAIDRTPPTPLTMRFTPRTGDLTVTPETLEFSADSPSPKEISIFIVDDTEVEGQEQVFIDVAYESDDLSEYCSTGSSLELRVEDNDL